MPGFFYFFELSPEQLIDAGQLRRDVLARYGLDQVLSDCTDVPDHAMVTAVRTGPGGQPGVVLYPKSPRADSPLDWGYNPAHQTWIPQGEWGLGYETARPPEPESLERREVFCDYFGWDRLGQSWKLPVARYAKRPKSIPVEYRRTASGVDCVPARQWRALWDLAGQIHDWLYDDWQPADQDAWKYDTAVTILSVNYRVGVGELNLLQELDRGVLTSETIDPILCALIDNDLPEKLRAYLDEKKSADTEPLPAPE